MYVFQKRDPNKERFWKAIIYEEKNGDGYTSLLKS